MQLVPSQNLASTVCSCSKWLRENSPLPLMFCILLAKSRFLFYQGADFNAAISCCKLWDFCSRFLFKAPPHNLSSKCRLQEFHPHSNSSELSRADCVQSASLQGSDFRLQTESCKSDKMSCLPVRGSRRVWEMVPATSRDHGKNHWNPFLSNTQKRSR